MRCCRTTILSAVLLAGVTTALSQPAASSLHLDLHSRETINITAWGANSLRVRVAVPGNQISDSVPGALIEPGSDNKGAPLAPPTAITVKYFECQLDASDCTAATITNGNVMASVSASGMVTITRVSDNAVLLQEQSRTSSNLTELRPSTYGHHPAAAAAQLLTVAINNSASKCCKGAANDPCCMDVDMWGTADGTPVRLSNCHGNESPQHLDTNQRYSYDPAQNSLIVQSCGKCVSVNSDGRAEIDTCQGLPNQVFSVPAVGSTGLIRHGTSGKCLGAATGDCGSAISLVDCDTAAPSLLQQWDIAAAPRDPPSPSPPPSPKYSSTTEVFASTAAEAIYGFGEHQQGNLDNKGVTYNMEQCLEYGHSHGGEVCLPWILAAEGGRLKYGFLWNMPNYGDVAFGETTTAWTATAASQIDYFITVPGATATGAAAGQAIMNAYVDAVGHSPMLPSYAAGYWHSRNRYSSQDMLLDAAWGFHTRGINVSVIVIDYMHWKNMGDYSFDPASWPDVPGMMANLTSIGMKVMVSAWPFQAVGSSSIHEVGANGWAVTTQGTREPSWWDDNNCKAKCYLYDATQKAAREFVWSKLHDGYYQHGIKIFWLDASEPEISTRDAQAAANYFNNSQGTGQEVGMMYPYHHTRTIHDGLLSEGETETILLTRSAWAGMQRWGAALWSGDTSSHWGSLKVSVQAGLNTQMSGIAWWTTDIGGYSGGDPSDPTFRELIVRWFQYGMTCPLFRQHGARATEIWGYGNVSEAIIADTIKLRTQFEPYLMHLMEVVSQTGQPVNRPLFWDFPGDPTTWSIKTQFMWGPDYLVAPVTAMGAREWPVYLPKGATYKHYFNQKVYQGGQNVTVDAPLNQFPLFKVTRDARAARAAQPAH